MLEETKHNARRKPVYHLWITEEMQSMDVNWLLLGAIVGVLILTILEVGGVYGIRHLKDPEEACPTIGVLYLKASEKRITKFMYEIAAFEAPFLCILLAGYLLAPFELIDFLFGYPNPSIDSFLTFAMISFDIAIVRMST